MFDRAEAASQHSAYNSFPCCICTRPQGDPRHIRTRGGGHLQPAVSGGHPGHHLQQVLSSRGGEGGGPPAGAGHPHRMDHLQRSSEVQRHAQDPSRVRQSSAHTIAQN